MSIENNYRRILEQTCNNNVEIIAVSKYASTSEIDEAYKYGLRNFAENYIQDAIKRIEELSYLTEIKWHFIGKLQKNKIRNIIGKFHLIHSIDSFELAEIINKRCEAKGISQNILLQVNILNDDSKAGFKTEEVYDSFNRLINLKSIKVKGLMTIAPKTEDKEILKKSFSGLKELRNQLNATFNSDMQELSMGMSSDYKTAIECSSTMIRIGRSLFKGLEN